MRLHDFTGILACVLQGYLIYLSNTTKEAN